MTDKNVVYEHRNQHFAGTQLKHIPLKKHQRAEGKILKYQTFTSIINCLGSVFIGLTLNSALRAQEFYFQFNGCDHVYVIPGDTLLRNIHLGSNYFDTSTDLLDIDTLSFTFAPHNADTIEYLFGPFAYSFDWLPTNTFLLESTSLSNIDSMFMGPLMIDSTLVEGVRYVDMPGDSISGFQLVLSGESPSTWLQYIQVSYVTQECSDWRRFQPLAVGNIWNLSVPSESSHAERLEVLERVESEGSQRWIIAQERIEGYNYSLLPPDTFSVVTFDHDLYKIYWGADGGSGWLINDFRPFTNEYPQFGIEGVVPLSEGNVGYMYNTSAGSEFWVQGIGITSGGWDGGGSLRLVGYRIDGEVWGDIGHLVDVVEKPILPQEFKISTYPNPFNKSFNIEIQVPTSGEVSLSIYDIQGERIWSENIYALENSLTRRRIEMNDLLGKNLSSGVYFVAIRAGIQVKTCKILLLR